MTALQAFERILRVVLFSAGGKKELLGFILPAHEGREIRREEPELRLEAPARNGAFFEFERRHVREGFLAFCPGVAGAAQDFGLFARRHDGLMGIIQVVELLHELFGHRKGLRGLEHEVAKEGIEVTQVLRRLRLGKELQGRLVADAEEFAKGGAVGGEALEDAPRGEAALEPPLSQRQSKPECAKPSKSFARNRYSPSST